MTRPALIPGTRPGTELATGLAGIADPSWMAHAACRRRDSKGQLYYSPELWFPVTNAYSTPLAVCRSCPVTAQCLEWAMANEGGHTSSARFGMYGGLTPDQRAALAKEQT